MGEYTHDPVADDIKVEGLPLIGFIISYREELLIHDRRLLKLSAGKGISRAITAFRSVVGLLFFSKRGISRWIIRPARGNLRYIPVCVVVYWKGDKLGIIVAPVSPC